MTKKKNNSFFRQHAPLAMAVLLVIVLLSILLAVTFGNADISLQEAYSVIARELFHMSGYEAFSEGAVHDVVWLIRCPRVILALGIGMGLSVCGSVMQALVKNPLADPYVLGISSGASLGATLAIIFGVGSVLGSKSVGFVAFIGAMITAFLVLFLAEANRPSSAGKLILAGMAVSSVASAFSSFALYVGHNANATQEVMFFTMGSLASANWDTAIWILLIMMAGTIFFWSQYRTLNLMLLGDETSITLGTNLRISRAVYMIISSFMIGFAVYASGTIGFVGLVIPHVVRMLFGTDHHRLIPLCALFGSIFLIWADVACRVILKTSELPIGILVSMIGAPCFIYLMIRRSYGFGGKE